MNFSQPGFERLKVNHIGYVVDDVEAAVQTWAATYGAGPFYYFPDPRFEELYFKGEPVDFSLSAAIGNFGTFTVELTKYAYPTPIPELAELLGTENNAFNHVAFLAEDTAAASARLEELGYPMFLAGRLGEDRWFWHDARAQLGHCIEIHTDVAPLNSFDALLARMAQGWDGSDPLRTEFPADAAAELQRYL